MDSVSIRTATGRDLAAIPGIELAAAGMFSEQDLPHGIRYRVTTPEDLRAALDDNRLWVAVGSGDKVVGFAMVNIVDGQAYLDEIDVLPDFGRRGIGARLVGTVADWARNCAYETLSLVTFRHLRWNAPFYAKLGFSTLDSSEHGREVSGLIQEEGRAGIDISNRVVMRLEL